MESNKKTTKIIILTRHGLRIDHTQFRNKQKLHTDDPELILKGREQAVDMAIQIKSFIQNKYNKEKSVTFG